jgi:bifunctional DNA-binding transcriptional regulator/antitoxin component of YhaV-PrlF toxin-antitoxin module
MLKRRDIIEILTTDDDGRHKLRRVRVSRLRDLGDSYDITGENMHGDYPKDYVVPKRPYRGQLRNFREKIGWKHSAPVTVGEE